MKMKRVAAIGLMACGLAFATTTHAGVPPRYVITDIGSFGGSTEATALNDLARVVGTSAGYAFLWEDGVMTNLGEPFGGYTRANDVNNDGWVVGMSGSRAFLYADGVMRDIGTLGGSRAAARGINETGTIVGDSWDSDSVYRAFLWDEGVMIDLGTLGGNRSWAYDINNAGNVVGNADIPSGEVHACMWVGDETRDLGTLGGSSSWARALNEYEQVVGKALTVEGEYHAFLWSDGAMHDLGALERSGARDSWAFDINNAGLVVGRSKSASGLSHAVLWEDGEIYDLNDLVPTESGWEVLFGAYGTNEKGQIVGYGKISAQEHAFLLTPVIESVNATYLDSAFTPTGGEYSIGELTVSDEADIVVENAAGQTTYDDGSVSMATSLFADKSAGGLASGIFRNGTLVFQDADGIDLLTGDLIELELHEVIDGAGLLAGQGLFEVTGGSLEEAFYLPYGEIVQITFQIDPADIDDFSGAFTGVSNITLTPIPEPATLSLLTVGAVALIRRRRK